ADKGDGSSVADGDVAISIQGDDGEVMRTAGKDREREAGELQVSRGRGVRDDARLSATRDGRIGCFLNSDRLTAGGLESRGEGVNSGVKAGEGVTGGQHGLRVGAAEDHIVNEARRGIAEGVLGGYPEGLSDAGGGFGGEAAHGQMI